MTGPSPWRSLKDDPPPDMFGEQVLLRDEGDGILREHDTATFLSRWRTKSGAELACYTEWCEVPS